MLAMRWASGGIITPEHITRKMEVKKGDILLIHTGWHHYYVGEREANELYYFCYHPRRGAGPG